MQEENILLQAQIEKSQYDKLGRIASVAGVKRSDVTRKAVDDFIREFESKHGEIDLKKVPL